VDLSLPPSGILASMAELARESWGEVVRQATLRS
jgi:5-methylcytosine-specific restriction enzyme subunit McrC